MLVKVHKSYRDVVAICDPDLIGKHLSEKDSELNVKENFFKGDDVSEEELLDLIQRFSQEDATFNIVGEKSIECAVKAGLISEEGIRKIEGVPCALVLI